MRAGSRRSANGKPNAQNNPPRTPSDNDTLAFTAGTNIEQCLKLDFVRDSIGAYQNPVMLNAGIDVGGRMFVILATAKNAVFSTRSVVAVSDDDGNSYHYLYDFSAPSCTGCDGAKFVPSPSFFVIGGPYVLAQHADFTLLGPSSLNPALFTPAKPGEVVVLYANGFGPTTSPVVSGSLTQSGNLAPLPVVKIGGIAAKVLNAALVAPGQFQFNVMVPLSTADGNNAIAATYNGISTQGNAVLAVQH
jgi:hypothetical protein